MGHVATLQEILNLPDLKGAHLVAGQVGPNTEVRWCHISEVLDIARLLSGSELLLTTGLALNVGAEKQNQYIHELHQRGVAGLMLELGRQFDEIPTALIEAADATGLPLISLPFDTPFVKVTEAVHTLVLGRRNAPDQATAPERHLCEDLLSGQLHSWEETGIRLRACGLAHPGSRPSIVVLLADVDAAPNALRAAATAEIAHHPVVWLAHPGQDGHCLIALAEDRLLLERLLKGIGQRLRPISVGIGRGYSDPDGAGRSLAEARQIMRLRRYHPGMDPLFAESGVYRLALAAGAEEAQEFVSSLLAPLIQYDRVHRTYLCQTLRYLLDDGMVMAEAARRLYITRQALYHRMGRITEIMGRDLTDPEVRLSLAVALRLQEAIRAGQ